MKQLQLLTLGHAVAVLALTVTALGIVEAANSTERAYVSGGGITNTGDVISVFAVNAGKGARGIIIAPSHQDGFPPLTVARVVCLCIEGRKTWITAVPEKALPDSLVFVLVVQDNGHTGDLVALWLTRPEDLGVSKPSDICGVAQENGVDVFSDLYLRTGNIIVHGQP